WATNGTIQTSDQREKNNINDLNYGLREIMKLRPVSFHWNKNPELGRRIGFIAQEVEPVLKEVVVKGDLPGAEKEKRDDGTEVTGDANDKMGVFYSDIVPVAVKAIQEQQHQIETLKAENEKLKKEIELIKQKLGL
ncbi:MAG: tail fiber domain-containing protein, partial [Chitinophagaceae bacterium]